MQESRLRLMETIVKYNGILFKTKESWVAILPSISFPLQQPSTSSNFRALTSAVPGMPLQLHNCTSMNHSPP
jgi:hypothetical protein